MKHNKEEAKPEQPEAESQEELWADLTYEISEVNPSSGYGTRFGLNIKRKSLPSRETNNKIMSERDLRIWDKMNRELVRLQSENSRLKAENKKTIEMWEVDSGQIIKLQDEVKHLKAERERVIQYCKDWQDHTSQVILSILKQKEVEKLQHSMELKTTKQK